MLESGVGRAHNIALSTLPNFVLPGDVSASRRYWARDIIEPAVDITPRGTIVVGDAPGFGYNLDMDFIDRLTDTEGSSRLSQRSLRIKLYSLIALMVLFWSLNFIVAKIALRSFPPLLLASLRTTLAALFILPVYLWKRRREDAPRVVGERRRT